MILAACALLTHFWPLRAATVFKVVESESILTASGVIATSIPIGEQGPGSLATTYGGEFLVNLGDDSIQFLEGSFLDANINGEWQPAAAGEEGFAPADFAGQAAVFFGSVKGAFREIRLVVSSEAIPLAGTNFDGRLVGYQFPEGGGAVFDYNAGLFGVGALPLQGMKSFSKIAAAKLERVGGVATLRLEYEADYKFTTLAENDSTLTLKGSILARHEPPPPPALAIRLISTTQSGGVVLEANSADPGLVVEISENLANWAEAQPQTIQRDPAVPSTLFQLPPASASSRFFRLRR